MIPLIISGALIGFIIFFCLMSGLIAVVSGWRKIASVHPFNETTAGNRIEKNSFCSLNIGYNTKYTNCMVISFYETGIQIKPGIMFRAFHPPLFFEKDILKKASYNGTEQYGMFSITIEGRTIFIYGKIAARIHAFTKSSNPYF